MVSCIVPVYNGAKYLTEALESVLRQSWGGIDLLVVDDGSTDDTAHVAQSFGSAVRYFRQDNSGPPTARNRGVAEALGTHIGFLDADDVWTDDKISQQMKAFGDDPEVDFCVAMAQNFWTAEVAHERTLLAGHPRLAPIPGYVTGTLLATREAFRRTGPFDPALTNGDAADWFLRARDAGLKERLVSEVLLFRRLHETNLSRQMADVSRDEFLHLLKNSLDRRRATSSDA